MREAPVRLDFTSKFRFFTLFKKIGIFGNCPAETQITNYRRPQLIAEPLRVPHLGTPSGLIRSLP
jgi:hypothetical protein